MKRVLLINRNDFRAKDGATKSLFQLYHSLPQFGIKTDFIKLKYRGRFKLLAKWNLKIKILRADAIILNGSAVALEPLILDIIQFVKKYNKATYFYFRENHLQLNKYFPELLKKEQQYWLQTLAQETYIKHWFVSHYSKKSFQTFFQTDERNSVVVYNGVQSIHSANKYKLNEKAQHTIAIIGSIQAMKGYDFLVRFAKSMHSLLPTVQFIWYGKGNQKENFINLIQEADASAYIQIIEYSPLEKIMHHAKAVFVCSEAESFSRVAIEALQFQKKLFVRACLEGTIEITKGVGMAVNEEWNEQDMQTYVQYLLDTSTNEELLQIVEQYNMKNHCQRILKAIEN
ncbi:MAG: glycosyltransferase [Chitinophagaceae bacterium]